MPPKAKAPKRTLDDFYKTFLLNSIGKADLKESAVHNLYQIPKRDKSSQNPHYTAGDKNAVYQADVLFMPADSVTKDRYILVVADIETRICDAEPMKGHSAEDTIEAFKKIFKRKTLPAPKYLMQTDPGSEFENAKTKQYFESLKIGYRFGKPRRSRQQAVVEAKNKIIAKALFMRMTANELQTGEKDTDWVEFLPSLIKEMNKIVNDKPKVKKPEEPVIKKETILLEKGQKVRVQLDKPRAIEGTQANATLSGHFRATDIRWDPEIKEITNVILTPGQPPLYQVSGDNKVAYTFNQLQTVDEGQEKKKPYSGEKYVVEKIMKSRTVGRGKNAKTEYLVKWKDYPDSANTWEPESISNKPDVAKMIDILKRLQK